MKKLYWIFAICLLLTACGSVATPETTTTNAPTTTEPHPDALIIEGTTTENSMPQPSKNEPSTNPVQMQLTESSAWAKYARYSDKMGIVLNEPVADPPVATTTWIEGEYECAYIVPRFCGSTISLYMLEWSPDFSTYTIADTPDFTTVSGDGCVIYTVLPRPEGMPLWYLEINAPNGVGDGYVLEYNGNTGTPEMEFFTYRNP